VDTAYANEREPQPFESSLEKFEEMTSFLGSSESLSKQHHELEVYVEEHGREMLRRMMQGHLDVRAAAERRTEVRGSDEVERCRVREETCRPLRLIFGDVQVKRLLYQADGVEGLAPMDASLNLPTEMFSFGIRGLVAREVACNSYEHAVRQLERYCAKGTGKRQVEELAMRAAEDFDAFYEEGMQCRVDVSGDDLLVLTFDGAAIRVLVDDLREATRKKRLEDDDEPQRWPAPKGATRRAAKRRAMIAGVYDVSPFPRTAEDIVRDLQRLRDATKPQRPNPVNKRIWASVVQDCEGIVEEGFAEALKRDPKRQRTWVILVDGDEHQLDCIRRCAEHYGVAAVILLDVIHVLGYLWDAAYCFHERGSDEAEAWVMDRLVMLLTGTDPSQVAAGMRRSATRQGLVDRADLDKCATYLINHRDIMNYEAALGTGMPIATGVIEGAARYVVRDRMDKTGARWSTDGAEAVLRLRALEASHDFDAYWSFHVAKEYSVHHASRYADGAPPLPFPTAPSRPKLRLVKS